MEFTHIDEKNQPSMVDVSDKNITKRTATAVCHMLLGEEIISQLIDGDIQTKKGPVFQTAIIAGTMAAKKTWDLIPFCHPIPLEKCKILIELLDGDKIKILATCVTTGKTGIEMEALTAASVASLTVYDMCKALNKEMVIEQVRLIEKTGGKSDFNMKPTV